jgi:hypothetical protein
MFPAFIGLLLLAVLVFLVGMISAGNTSRSRSGSTGTKLFAHHSLDRNMDLTGEIAMKQAEFGTAQQTSPQITGFSMQTGEQPTSGKADSGKA